MSARSGGTAGTTELTGKLPAEAVRTGVPRLSAAVIERFKAIDDLTGTLSDVLDELGLHGAIAASVLLPTIPGARIVGTAITILDQPAPRQPHLYTRERTSLLGEIEAHNQAERGDVLVIQGIPGVSSLGGLSASAGQRQGEIGAIVDGGIRDVGSQTAMGYPAWTKSVTPVTGKWRLETVAVNGPVTIEGVRVNAGDLAVADETGVCFVPAALVEQVLERVEEIVAGEALRQADIAAGLSVPELANKSYAYKQSNIQA